MPCASASQPADRRSIVYPVSTTEEDPAHAPSGKPELSLPVLLACIALAGACGAVLRLLLVELSDEQFMRFPWITLIVNLTGSGTLGLLFGVAHAWPRLPRWTLPVVGTGFLGSYTTFSSVILASTSVQQSDVFAQLAAAEVIPPDLWEAGAYLVISMIFCTAAAAAGITVGRAVFGYTGERRPAPQEDSP
ncbi:CrcB family protein [Nesterenkonia salmonea]|uniref:Fluoride-specific ion channel n=1 Tax=Nesterenkonia salmonea TaxID=1804987 RepID=A0A5R9B9H9_9MICC|nr:CrcB family protein [Nesterenkonia salmonea]